jgi:hypothetical protein
MAVVGPAAGFFIGGESLKQHTELTLKVAELSIYPDGSFMSRDWIFGLNVHYWLG